ncbi:hypothetical protein L6164_018287 [Bauhinia variegata]|uniref:Uncharacterized protein n=1 Tax=Bauhinia variegata TaxID=167791 RepID=A0ACB9NC29_BAUVA|nr:hypothetical protein L6164_018287 [Bauhinia variegata]
MEMVLSPFFLFWLLTFCSASSVFGSNAILVEDEVLALKHIAKTLGKFDWDFNIDPCSGQNDWITTLVPTSQYANNVICDCSFNDATLCHVVSIILTGQNLNGTLPPELVRLPYLKEINLTRNYLNGTIPREWGTMKLINISLLGNRLTGPIPKELGNITTLWSLDLEDNQFSGNLPPELGNLTQIERLFISANSFTGEIPASFAKLTTLKHVRIGDNQFSGKIPDFIQHWTSLEELLIQGSGLSGPIPSGISFLEDLTKLTITELNGPASTFPQLSTRNLKKWKILILRNCNINGTIPEYLGNMTNLKTLDLSYNKLSGPIPSTFDRLGKVDHMYLTGNFLNGSLPEWMKDADPIDLSYNNFSIKNPAELTCQKENVNLFASSSMDNSSGSVSCVESITCPKTWYSLHINCGGKQTVAGIETYDADLERAEQSLFHQGGDNWAFSNTGHFVDNEHFQKNYIRSTKSMNNSELYMDARVSAISLTYYGFCLGKGNYTIRLHFAEIIFTDDETFSSLGRRIFNVYIQGNQVLKDFDIAKEAGGVRKAVVKEFTAIVTSNNLEIRFYWAGKGTTEIPYKSVYGPLISAISVNPDFTPPSENGSTSTVAVVAIVMAAAIIVVLIFAVLWWRGCLGKKSSLARELKGLDLGTTLFTSRQIKAATNNFGPANKIGEGGFGPVYKGILSDGTRIAVKQLSSGSRQGNREFINEMGMISALQHPCLVRLYGCCVDRDQLLLVYEYMENNSLARALFGPEECQLKLNWQTRYKICLGVAKVVSGKTKANQQPTIECFSLLDWALVLKERGNLMELVDRRLGSHYNAEEVMVVIKVALLCTNVSPTLRPTMSSVVSMLEGRSVVQELVSDSSEVLNEMRLEAMRQHYQQVEENRILETQVHCDFVDGPFTYYVS